jgi:hypothetical protein
VPGLGNARGPLQRVQRAFDDRRLGGRGSSNRTDADRSGPGTDPGSEASPAPEGGKRALTWSNSGAPVGIRTPNLLIRSLGARVHSSAAALTRVVGKPFDNRTSAPQCNRVAVSVAVSMRLLSRRRRDQSGPSSVRTWR